jgi:hypothetical protein
MTSNIFVKASFVNNNKTSRCVIDITQKKSIRSKRKEQPSRFAKPTKKKHSSVSAFPVFDHA